MTAWMPMYWGDYLKKTGHLTTEEHGAYLLLICHLWTTSRPIPDDDKRLATVTKSSMKKWKIMRPILSEFFEISEGHWQHQRVNEEIARSLEIKEKRANAGSEGGKKRQANAIANAMAIGIAKGVANGVAKSNQSQSQSHLPIGDTILKDHQNALDCRFSEFWDIVPLKIGKASAARAYKAAIKRGASHEAIIAGITGYSRAIKDAGTERRFIKHPASWLNDDRWLDESQVGPSQTGGNRNIGSSGRPVASFAQVAADLIAELDGR